MKALLVGGEWFPNVAGGLNRYLYGEACVLPDIDVHGTIMVSYIRDGQTSRLKLRGMAPEGASLRARWQGARAIAQEVIEEGIDMVNSHFALYTYPWMHRLPNNMPMVVNFQGPYADEMAAEYPGIARLPRILFARHIERTVYRRADRIITLSNAFRNLVHNRYGIPLDRIKVVPGAITLEPYFDAPDRSTARQRLGWPADKKILLSVRRLARRMGLEALIDAMVNVVADRPDTLLFIAGTGEIAAELQQRIEQHALQANVRLLGFLPDQDLPTAFAAADLAIVPTVSLEGFGLVTAEALASGTPVMGTPVGGTSEILHDLNPALLFASTHPDSMANGIRRALNGWIALPTSPECRAYAARYGWNAVIRKNRAVFDEALTARRIGQRLANRNN